MRPKQNCLQPPREGCASEVDLTGPEVDSFWTDLDPKTASRAFKRGSVHLVHLKSITSFILVGVVRVDKKRNSIHVDQLDLTPQNRPQSLQSRFSRSISVHLQLDLSGPFLDLTS